MTTEKRLIEFKELREQFRERYGKAFMQIVLRTNKEYWRGYTAGINWGINTIADAPTVDVVEVVRCRDCKHCEHGCKCRLPLGASLYDNDYILVEPEDFCSFGERKDE